MSPPCALGRCSAAFAVSDLPSLPQRSTIYCASIGLSVSLLNSNFGLSCRLNVYGILAARRTLRDSFCNLLPFEHLSNAFGIRSERIGQKLSVPARRSVIFPSADGVREGTHRFRSDTIGQFFFKKQHAKHVAGVLYGAATKLRGMVWPPKNGGAPSQSAWWRHDKSRFSMFLLLPTATLNVLVTCWQCASYENRVAEVAVFLCKKVFKNGCIR